MSSWRSAPLPKGWAKTRARVLRRDGTICHVCHLPCATEVDHIIPAVRGGTDADSNLAAICVECHKEKTNKERTGGSRRREPEAHPGLSTSSRASMRGAVSGAKR